MALFVKVKHIYFNLKRIRHSILFRLPEIRLCQWSIKISHVVHLQKENVMRKKKAMSVNCLLTYHERCSVIGFVIYFVF